MPRIAPAGREDSAHWQGVTRAVEDRLSDALHEQLTQRFIDRRTSVLMKRLREDDIVDLKLDDSGGVVIGGEAVGKLDGFRFAPDPRAEGIHGRTLRAAALKGLEGEFFARATRLAAAPMTRHHSQRAWPLWWDGAIVGQLAAGPAPLDAVVHVARGRESERRTARRRCRRGWTTGCAQRIATRLRTADRAARCAPRPKPEATTRLPALARGIAHQLGENFGSLDRAHMRAAEDDLRPLIRALEAVRRVVRPAQRSICRSCCGPDAARLLACCGASGRSIEQMPRAAAARPHLVCDR